MGERKLSLDVHIFCHFLKFNEPLAIWSARKLFLQFFFASLFASRESSETFGAFSSTLELMISRLLVPAEKLLKINGRSTFYAADLKLFKINLVQKSESFD